MSQTFHVLGNQCKSYSNSLTCTPDVSYYFIQFMGTINLII
ncbi:hypothetical protein C5167_011413 [Papaver somniferum]|uniref:Uncharacterized protein n=1 Tax=Papaver somniferum TaxID=3469 RepID=A0A4Y7K5U7_PAPSO|nr:hypothetical protein C5167_011413 [Papaver somniferum]